MTRPSRLILASALLMTTTALAHAEFEHAIAMHGEPAKGPDEPFSYVNPDAPKGGSMTPGIVGTIGSFDSLNPFIIKGVTPSRLTRVGRTPGLVFEPLMTWGLDEPFTLYGVVAEGVETDEERTYVSFLLHPEARFSDGEAITADDVLFTFELLKEKGRPSARRTYGNVKTAEIVDERTIRFTFNDDVKDRELPLIMALMPVLPEHATDAETFEDTTLDIPIGSGPYTIAAVDAGSSITFERDEDWWGADLPVNRGQFNFDTIKLDYYRDGNTQFEAFKRGLIDFVPEGDPTRWMNGYDFPAATSGEVVRETFEVQTPAGMNGFVFNTRRPMFSDIRVREALTMMFDAEWANKNLFFDAYTRNQSFFSGSDLSSFEKPADEAEQALLADYSDEVRPDILDGSYKLPETDASGRDRQKMRDAMTLLREAGYETQGGQLVNGETGEPLAFEVMVQHSEQERLALNWQDRLRRIGVQLNVRVVDSAQFERRRIAYDFDMMPFIYPASMSPGNEQNFRWSSEAAENEGTFNMAGVRSEAVDTLIGRILDARKREDFDAAVRAYDRVLRSGFYVMPLFYLGEDRVAYYDKFAHPEETPLYGYYLDSWWQKQGDE